MNILHKINAVSAVLCFCFLSISSTTEQPPLCSFPNHKTQQAVLLKRIQPLLGRIYKFSDGNKYNYIFGICTDVDPSKDLGESVSVVQHAISDKKTYVIGHYSNTQIIDGSDWLMLEYLDGDSYTSHCGSEKRRARLMISCNKTVEDGKEQIVILEEETEKSSDCFYLFEMETSLMCQKEPIVTVSLSVGSILVIIFIVVVILYLALGFLYNRLVLGAKGREQMPNYSFWQDFGNLQADGCSFICRTGNKPEPKQYKGVGDDMLQEEDERDDHLLPM